MTAVRPLACSPASRTALFTWALGTSGTWEIPCSAAPSIVRGGRPFTAAIDAPMRVNGSMTRRIGRLERDASPPSTVLNGCAASSPAKRRIDVPEFAASSGPAGGRKPPSPKPSIVMVPAARAIRTPSASRQASVAAQSAPGA